MQICTTNIYHTTELKATNWNTMLSAITANRSLTLTFKKNPVPLRLKNWYTIPATICAAVKPRTDARAMFFASRLIITVKQAAASVRENNIIRSFQPVYFSCTKHRQIKSNGISNKEEKIKPVAPKCFTIRFAATKAIRKAIYTLNIVR